MILNLANTTIGVTFANASPLSNFKELVDGAYNCKCFLTKDNKPPMPLFDAHLGGLFI